MHEIQGRVGNGTGSASPRGIYQAADGGWLSIAASNQGIAKRLFAAMDRPGLIEDPRFATNPARLANNDAIQAIVIDWVAAMPGDEVLAHPREVRGRLRRGQRRERHRRRPALPRADAGGADRQRRARQGLDARTGAAPARLRRAALRRRAGDRRAQPFACSPTGSALTEPEFDVLQAAGVVSQAQPSA